MLIVASILLGAIIAWAMILLVLAAYDLIGRRWRLGLLRLSAALVLVIVGIAGLRASAPFGVPTHTYNDDRVLHERARALGKTVAGLRNVALLGLPVGLVAGAVLVWRKTTLT
jgi:hypothetical protein